MDQRFERIISTQRALWLLRKFETLNLPNMGIQDKFHRILSHYARDIELISKIYQKNKGEPPIARDLPPIAGKKILLFDLISSFFSCLFNIFFNSFSMDSLINCMLFLWILDLLAF